MNYKEFKIMSVVLLWSLCIFANSLYSAQETSAENTFWERIQRLYDTQGRPLNDIPSNWKDCEDKNTLNRYLLLNNLPSLDKWKFYPNLLGYGVFNSPEKAREDLSKEKTDAWGNIYNQILPSSANGNIIWDAIAAPLNNIGMPSYNPGLNNRYIICLKGDIHSQFTDTFRNQNGKAFHIIARTLNIIGSPGSKYENSYLDSISSAVTAAKCRRANIFVGKNDPIANLPSSIQGGHLGGESGAAGLRFKTSLGDEPEWYKEVFRIYRVDSGHLLDSDETSEKNYFGWMKEILSNPLQYKNQQTLNNFYIIMPVKEKKITETDYEQSNWYINNKIPVYLWKQQESAKSVVNAISSRKNEEYPNEKINIVITGDPSDERNQALRKALNDAGYMDRNIYFVFTENLYDSDGRLLAENYVPSGNPINEAVDAVLKLKKDTGLNGYAVASEPNFSNIRIGDNNDLSGRKKDDDGDNNNDDDNDHRPPYPFRLSSPEQTPQHPSPPPPLPQPTPNIPSIAKIAQPTYNPPEIPRIGGVLLHQVAKIKEGQNAQVDLAAGDFSLIIEGKNAQLDPDTFKKFITALWAVYYGEQDPGISIDPIASGSEKHMVRYIGKVVNTDLGRVMRDADYLMKKWAVGTERPDIPGFKNPDDVAAEKGVKYVGIASRFWFVPEDMSFKRSDNMLLFDKGNMKVKTEYMCQNADRKADQANEKFAEFFTDHYQEIAQKYPVYKELFEYAKMVSLAKYLKENNVPLFWFLMANKDLVITEDSPGTVDALAKGSDYFKNIYIEGGVELGRGNYVYDYNAVMAINKAASSLANAADSKTTLLSSPDSEKKPPSLPFSFELKGQNYSVLPQHSLTSGKDRRGIRYQTDIAFRDAGFMLTDQSFEMLRSEVLYTFVANSDASDSQSADQQELTYREASEKTDKILMRLEKLKDKKFSDEKDFVKVVEENIDALENSEQLKQLILKNAYFNTILEIARYYNSNNQDIGELGKGWHLLIPYRIKPVDDTKKEFLNILVPKQMAMENLITGQKEILTFSTDRYSIAGYVPDKIQSSQVVGLFIMNDASYRLADKLGNEFWFDQTGRLTDMCFSENHRVHFEYLQTIENDFEKSPYLLQAVGSEQIEFLNVLLPKTMIVKNIINDTNDILVFTDNSDKPGYVPKNDKISNFKMLSLMSDGSFTLLDKQGNESTFSAAGKFERLTPSQDFNLVKSIAAGQYKVDFKYTIDNSGRILIANAGLSEKEKSKTIYSVNYEYDEEGRLCKADASNLKIAMIARPNEKN